jgi:hypothetical protein
MLGHRLFRPTVILDPYRFFTALATWAYDPLVPFWAALASALRALAGVSIGYLRVRG